jgi:stage IV sporulation protein B
MVLQKKIFRSGFIRIVFTIFYTQTQTDTANNNYMKNKAIFTFSICLLLLAFLISPVFASKTGAGEQKTNRSLLKIGEVAGLDGSGIATDNNADSGNSDGKSDTMLDADDIWGVRGYDGGEYVYIGGRPIGIVVNAGGLIVLGTNAVGTENGDVNPLAGADLQKGDLLTEINGEATCSLYALKKAVTENKIVKLTFRRGDRNFKISVTPVTEKLTGEKKIGLIAKEDIGGVGTLTFVTENGRFGALGHHIADPESGLKEQLNHGNLYNTRIERIIKGEKGKAGGLCASVSRAQKPIGKVDKNINIGIYGDYSADTDTQKIRVAARGEAKMGGAQILTTINGDTPKFYDIDIIKVVTQTECAEKGMVIAVRDKELLEKTGGIVQGMSGSPIVQNGVLIGAVTHVFISDPTRGYAVHSRFMLEEAQGGAASMESVSALAA